MRPNISITEILSCMIDNWMTKHLVSDENCNIVTLKCQYFLNK